jgi:hypothetical protein
MVLNSMGSNTRPFFGLRGLKLKLAMIILVVAPSFLLFGFNNGSTGGVVHLESFVNVRLFTLSDEV